MKNILLSNVLDKRLHYLLPAVSLHRMQVLHDLWGQSQTLVGQQNLLCSDGEQKREYFNDLSVLRVRHVRT